MLTHLTHTEFLNTKSSFNPEYAKQNDNGAE